MNYPIIWKEMPCNKFSYVIYKGIKTALYHRILILYVISDLRKYVNVYLFTNFKVLIILFHICNTFYNPVLMFKKFPVKVLLLNALTLHLS